MKASESCRGFQAVVAMVVLLALFGSGFTARPQQTSVPVKGTINPNWPHVVADGTGGWWPEAGYFWVEHDENGHPLPGRGAVHWVLGESLEEFGRVKWPHVVTLAQEGTAAPKPGYDWANVRNGQPVDWSVRWAPGIPYLDHLSKETKPLQADSKEGNWKPAPGYTWAHVTNHVVVDEAVTWVPGMAYRNLGINQQPHVVAGVEEGSWAPAPGYKWAHSTNGIRLDDSVSWSPGIGYSCPGATPHPHLLASKREGTWVLEKGFEWATPDPSASDFAVRPASPESKRARAEVLQAWTNYLHEIQVSGQYSNWSGPPYDLYLSNASK